MRRIGVAAALGALACGRFTVPPADPIHAATVGSATPVAPAASQVQTQPPSAELVKDERPRRLVVAKKDEPLLKSATAAAEACLLKAKTWGAMQVQIILADDGRPSATAEDIDARIPMNVTRCVTKAFAQGRFTPPDTPTDEGTTLRYITVKLRVPPPPQEYQVD